MKGLHLGKKGIIDLKKIAVENDLRYIKSEDLKIESIEHELYQTHRRNLYIINGKYIKLLFVNDYIGYVEYYWWNKDENKRKLIISNNKSFSEITNIDEIIVKIIRLYEKYLDSNIVIDINEFYLELEDKTKESYNGKAQIVFTEKTFKVFEKKELSAEKERQINLLLNLITNNLGKMLEIKENGVEQELLVYFDMLSKRNIKFKYNGMSCWFTEYVKPYKPLIK